MQIQFAYSRPPTHPVINDKKTEWVSAFRYMRYCDNKRLLLFNKTKSDSS